MSRFWNFFIDKYRFTYLLTTVIVLMGTLSAVVLPKESDPEVTVPIGIVSTFYPGASPLDVEELVTNEIEDEIDDLEDLDSFTSTSAEGVSSIVVEFDPRADIDGRIRALKDAVDDATLGLPGEVERPVVQQVSVNDEPIIVISIALDLSQEALKVLGNELQDELENIRGVSEAKIIGVRNREIQVTADLSKLELYNISVRDLVTALQQHDAQLPVGAIEQNRINYTVRFEGGIDTPSILSSIPITTVGGEPITIGDVADVTDGLEPLSSFSRLSLNGEAAEPSIGVEIFKNDGNDAIGTVAGVKEKISELQESLLKDAQIYYSQDRAERIQEDLSNLLWNGIQTVIIVFLLLYLFLGPREAALAGLCIPLTFLMTFLGLYVLGFTINFLSLFSLILSLGILVDSSIVIVEGMHKYLYLGEPPAMAAKKTILEFQAPVVSGLFTTISAFVPMMFASGITGQYIRVIPVTVILVLMFSLFVGLGIIPMIGSRLLKTKDTQSGAVTEEDAQMKFIQTLSRWYEVKLREFLNNKKLRRSFMLILVVLFVASMALPISGVLKSVLFPTNDSDQVFVGIEMPVGTTVEETDRVVRLVEGELYGDERIESFVSSTGSSGGQSARNSGSSGNVGRISITLVDGEERNETSDEISQELRFKLPAVAPEATLNFSQITSGPPQGSPVEITFRGEDIRELERLAYDGEQMLRTLDGPVDVTRSTQDTPFEFAFSIDRAKAAQTGLTPLTIAQALRTALFGVDALELKLDDEDVDVVVQLNLNPGSNDPHDTKKTSINAVEALLIPTPQGSIPLSALVDTQVQSSTDSIQHEDGERVAKVTSALSPGATTQEVLDVFDSRLDELGMQQGYTVKYGGEAQDVAQSFTDLYYAMIIGIFLIASILILQFNSYRQPFFILLALPLALIGVLPGLTITSQPLSFPAFIGIVALLGIVVNDAIILIDQINVNRRNGFSKQEAILKGGRARLQPIILTTVTTVAGILPLTLSDEVWGPLGFTIIFGLMFATVLTLVVIPVLYNAYGEKELG